MGALWDLLQGLKEDEKARQHFFFFPPGSAPASLMSSEQEGAINSVVNYSQIPVVLAHISLLWADLKLSIRE